VPWKFRLRLTAAIGFEVCGRQVDFVKAFKLVTQEMMKSQKVNFIKCLVFGYSPTAGQNNGRSDQWKKLMNVEHPPAMHMVWGIAVIEPLTQILYLSRPRFQALRAGRTSNHAIAMAMA